MFKNTKVNKIVNITISVLISILIVLVLIFTIYAFNSKKNNGIPKVFGKSYLTILSDSMDIENPEYDFKGFERGDMIVIERFQWFEVPTFEVGDIITFESQDDEGKIMLITHRIIEKKADHYITQGDVANLGGYSQELKDGFVEKVDFYRIVGSYVKTVPNVGHIFLFFQTSVGFLLVIVLPLLALFIFEILNFVKAYKAYRNEKHPKDEKTAEDLQKEIERLKAQLEQKTE